MQTIKKNWVYILFIVAVITFAVSKLKPAPNDVELKVIQTKYGWGYEVYKKGKLFIRQENIPVVEGSIAFKTREDAEKVGMLVVHKIKETHTDFPAILPKELDSLQISK